MTTEGREVLWRTHIRVKRAIRQLRAVTYSCRGAITVGHGVQLGRGCRILVQPGAHLVLGAGVEIDDGTTIAVYRGARLSLGQHSFVGHHCTLAVQDRVTIGSRTFIAELVSIRDHDHDPDCPPGEGSTLTAPVAIGSNVWLAAKVTVTRGVHIGDNAVVGANAVVTASLPDDVVAGGVPARVLRRRQPNERRE